jgi:SEC-C motif-containing protein
MAATPTHPDQGTGPCPCGRLNAKNKPLSYANCCQPWHQGLPAPTPEALMRSRYSAFVLGLMDYLRATWHPRTCPADLALEPGLQWLGLQVKDARLLDATHGEVHFVARSRQAGRGHRLEERSRFVHEEGRWWYVDGDLG